METSERSTCSTAPGGAVVGANTAEGVAATAVVAGKRFRWREQEKNKKNKNKNKNKNKSKKKKKKKNKE